MHNSLTSGWVRRVRGVMGHPLLLIALLFLSVVLVIRPWGNFPLNDDWQYARVAEHLAKTGKFHVDVAIAPALVGQAYLAAFFIKIFGFSHTLLRAVTMVLAVLLLWTVDNILRIAKTPRAHRVLACVTLTLNPIFLHLAFSFMTEIYGYLLALLAVWLWFAHRKAHGDRTGTPIAATWVCVSAAALIGASFWIRQFCVAVIPALFGSSLLLRVSRRDWIGILRSIPRILLSAVCFIAIVLGYFAWAKATGNYRPEFSSKIDEILRIDARLWTVETFELGTYLTISVFPFFVFALTRAPRIRSVAVLAFVIVAVTALAIKLRPEFAGFHHRVRFPYSNNIVNNAGVGPFTLSLEYAHDEKIPRWSINFINRLEWGLIILSFAWAFHFSSTHRQDSRSRELRLFSLLLAGIAFVLFVQAYQREVLDRYYFPVILAATLLMAGSYAEPTRGTRRSSLARLAVAWSCLVPLSWYTVCGLHDYFRWNEVRWDFAHRALAQVEANNLDGGFEVNGWLNWDNLTHNKHPAHCAGACRCAQGLFTCSDDTYQVSASNPPNRDVLAKVYPKFWMFDEFALYLTKRRN